MDGEPVPMKIGIVGLGYVGLVTAAVLANQLNEVIGVDIVEDRIEKLNSGIMPIYEPGLRERIVSAGKDLHFTSNFADLEQSDAVFICVPTPNNAGKVDLSYVLSASKTVSECGYTGSIIIKSTVPPGTARMVSENTGLNVISNPEFTREGSAVYDTEHPDRVIIGGQHTEITGKIWSFTGAHMVVTSNENAEIIKYASNAFLATKISFINQIADLCEKIDGSDVQVVARGMGLDRRIGMDFLKAGLGYGGSCFPKDTAAISAFAKERGVDLSIVDAVIAYNESRVENLAGKILRINGPLKGKKVCVLGLSFKDNTDDLRESRSLLLLNELQKKGAIISVYDPVVKNHGGVNICSTMEECISSADIVVTATEWKEFADIEPEMLANKKIFDLRRVFDNHKVKVTMGVGIGKN